MKKLKHVLAVTAILFMAAMPITASLVSDHGKPAIELSTQTAMSQDQAAPSEGDQAPAEPTYLDVVLKTLAESSAIVAGLLMVFEFILRVVPSAKPLSLLVPARYACNGLGAIFTFLGKLFGSLIEVANRTKK